MDGAYVFLTFLLQLTKKPQPGKVSRPGIEPGPLGEKLAGLPLDHSGSHRSRNNAHFLYLIADIITLILPKPTVQTLPMQRINKSDVEPDLYSRDTNVSRRL